MSKEKAEVVKDVLYPAMQRRLSSRGAAVEQPDYASLNSGACDASVNEGRNEIVAAFIFAHVVCLR